MKVFTREQLDPTEKVVFQAIQMALIAVLSAIRQYTELIKHQKIDRSDTLKTFGQILSLIKLKINKYKRLRDPEAKEKLQSVISSACVHIYHVK